LAADDGFFVTLLVAVTRAYRASDPLGRRQIKWLVYGGYVGALPALAFAASLSLWPEATGYL
jgi:hypothetical protein